MTRTLRIRRIGNSLGFILPKAMVDLLRVNEGDILHAVADDGAIRITPYDPSFDTAVKAYETTRAKYRKALRALAK